MTTEEKGIERTAQQYRDEGYAVTIHPGEDRLPSFAKGMQLDLIATRGEEKVVVEVKRSRSELNGKSPVADLARTVNAQPGWRFDLVILDAESPVERIAAMSQEPSDEQLDDLLDRARKASSIGLREMAIVYAWAALEAAMRRLRNEVGLTGKTTPTVLLSSLYSNGYLTRNDFDRARTAATIRNQTVHGFVAPDVDPALIDDIITLAQKVARTKETLTAPVAG
jgi:hypothetical protein